VLKSEESSDLTALLPYYFPTHFPATIQAFVTVIGRYTFFLNEVIPFCIDPIYLLY